jgi:hypothetical protein
MEDLEKPKTRGRTVIFKIVVSFKMPTQRTTSRKSTISIDTSRRGTLINGLINSSKGTNLLINIFRIICKER